MKAALFDLTVTLALLVTACDGDAADRAMDAGPQDASAPPIVGDWFACQEDCRTLQPGGLRFTAGLHVHHLISPRGETSYVEGKPYCVGESFATYVHDAGLLTMTFHDGSLETSSDFDVDGDAALHGTMLKVAPNGTGRWEDKECLAR